MPTLQYNIEARDRINLRTNMTSKREFYMIVEQDEDGMFIGEIPQLKACYSQGKTIDELVANIKEVIAMCLEEEDFKETSEFIGIQKVTL
ncbi:MAG: type II toxin-antitoxin system HicB family antitoxin [Crocosphaera sp.]